MIQLAAKRLPAGSPIAIRFMRIGKRRRYFVENGITTNVRLKMVSIWFI